MKYAITDLEVQKVKEAMEILLKIDEGIQDRTKEETFGGWVSTMDQIGKMLGFDAPQAIARKVGIEQLLKYRP